jgi:hypothetical protein
VGAATDVDRDGWALSDNMHASRRRSATILQYLPNGEQLAQVLGLEDGIQCQLLVAKLVDWIDFQARPTYILPLRETKE